MRQSDLRRILGGAALAVTMGVAGAAMPSVLSAQGTAADPAAVQTTRVDDDDLDDDDQDWGWVGLLGLAGLLGLRRRNHVDHVHRTDRDVHVNTTTNRP